MRRLFIFFLLVILTTCKPGKYIERSASMDLIDLVETRIRNTRGINYSMERAKIELTANKRYNFNGKIYINYDENIFLSFNYLGFELARLLITSDSVFYINRAERTYLIKSIKEIQEKYYENLSLKFLQNLLINGLVIPDNYQVKNIIKSLRKTENDEYIFQPFLTFGKNIKMIYNSELKLTRINFIDNRSNLFLNIETSYNSIKVPEKIKGEIINVSNKIDFILIPGKIENKSYKGIDMSINKSYSEIPF